MRFKLSILTLSYPDRLGLFFPRLMSELDRQTADRDDVEVLALVDNLTMSVGCKWNILVAAARGAYITVIGDDDMPSEDYVEQLCNAIEKQNGVDCIVFDTEMYRDGAFVARCKWGLEYEYKDDWKGKLLYRYPGELMAIRAEIRKRHLYADRWRGSDYRQSRAMRADLDSQYRINAVLYRYWNRSDNDTHIRMQARADGARKERRRGQMQGL